MAKFKPTKAWARDVKKATEKLIGYYKQDNKRFDCPFCVIFKDAECVKCPWIIFKGEICWEVDFSNTPPKQRFPRLYGWIRRCDNIIKGGS